MKYLVLSLVFLATARYCQGGPLRLQKRAAFYIANETACVVDSTVYSNGDPIPTDDPCEACKCRPPGFACVLKECEVKPGCRAVRRAGHCCPEYICGCEHNGRMYRDGDEIQDSQNPCYTCHCQGSSIACAFVDCFFRVDCAPEYVAGECCPRYTHCSSVEANTSIIDTSSFAIKTDSETEVTTISDIPAGKTTQLYDPTTDTSPEVPHEATKELPSEALSEAENPDPIHFISDSIEEYASETQDRGSHSNTQTLEENDTSTQSIQNIDSTESHEEVISETDNKPELTHTASEINKDESIEESETPEDEGSLGSIDSEISVPSETTVSKANIEIFADETSEVNKFEGTTTVQSSNEPKTTEIPIKHEVEIETNVIEKRFRSLENATSEDAVSEITTTIPTENGKPINTEIVSTQVQEKPTTFQEIKASTQVPETDSSSEALESKDTTSSLSDQTTNADKSSESLYYKAEEKLSVSDTSEAVTAVVHVHEETNSSINDVKTTSISSSSEPNLSTPANIPKQRINSEFVREAFSEIPY